MIGGKFDETVRLRDEPMYPLLCAVEGMKKMNDAQLLEIDRQADALLKFEGALEMMGFTPVNAD